MDKELARIFAIATTKAASAVVEAILSSVEEHLGEDALKAISEEIVLLGVESDV